MIFYRQKENQTLRLREKLHHSYSSGMQKCHDPPPLPPSRTHQWVEPPAEGEALRAQSPVITSAAAARAPIPSSGASALRVKITPAEPERGLCEPRLSKFGS